MTPPAADPPGGARGWRRWFSRKPRAPGPSPSAREPVALADTDEAWLDQLATDVSNGRRADEVGGSDFATHIDALWKDGREQLAIDWIAKFLGAGELPPARQAPLRARLVELYERRADLDAAVPHLEALTGDAAHATRAHYLLAEHHRHRGDVARALRHYEAVLARDVDYPNVQVRVARLRAEMGRSGLGGGGAGETIASSELAGVSAGARYRLVRELGRGATGVVYLARDLELERDVAVKLLHPHLAGVGTADALAQFFREARVMASLRHPNVVAVLDLDEKSRRIVMELAAGGTLRELLRDRGARTLRRAIERHVQILSALAAAHRRGFIHRDLKPANLMFRRDPDLPGVEVMLGDFGIAHLPDATGAVGPAAAANQRPAEAVGTLGYMAPEQRRGEPATPAVDLYAAGVVLFEMLSARVPWPRELLLAGIRRRTDFRLPESVTAGAPVAIVAALQAHLDALGDPDPAGRPSSPEALATMIRLREQAIGAGL